MGAFRPDLLPVSMAEIPGAVQAAPHEEHTGSGDAAEVECPICYQEYNQGGKCPRMLECLHVFCTECLQRIHLCPPQPLGSCGPPSIPCPLCRHPTPLEAGDALSLPCNSRILARLPPGAFRVPVSSARQLTTVTQRVVVSLEARDARFIILPTVSLRVEQMRTREEGRPTVPPGGEGVGLHQNRRALLFVQLLAITLWVLFVMICVIGVVFGPKIFQN
ncbi:RING finger domain-containing protein [Brienomyrus brachyistius]|uniref:RING finger domain-containing protein n=1 Tax=Brienomyrus brachyistius TaxID=42636 RepID=UPI0020B3435F|nr:RING finger domain-containing protein [Brienomyrus brachyistius]XP_048884796.1 RING finger domain-containing protein [Brienomyrus brachyistius]